MKTTKAASEKKEKKAEPRVEPPAFWLVWRDGYNSTPHRKHFSEAEARREAERLATDHPGELFYLLPASDYAIASVNPVAWLKRKDDEEVPF